jgi:hypothetical protein
LDVCFEKHIVKRFWEMICFLPKAFSLQPQVFEKNGEKYSVFLPHSGGIIWLQTLFEFRALSFTLPKTTKAFLVTIQCSHYSYHDHFGA